MIQAKSKTLKTPYHTWQIVNFPSLESTNTHLIQHSQCYVPFTCIVAKEQTKGHGKYNRTWYSASGKDLTFSMLIPLHSISQRFWNTITQTTALAIAKTLENLRISACIKWPNDVLIHGKKICGILCTKHNRTKNSQLSHEKEAMLIIGIGLNVNSREENIHNVTQPATSIFIECGIEYPKEKLLVIFLQRMSEYLYVLQKENFTIIRNQIEQRWCRQKKPITLVMGEKTHHGVISHLNEDASLQFRCEICGEIRVDSGELSVLG